MTAYRAWGRQEFKFVGTEEIIQDVRDLSTDLMFDAMDDAADRERNYSEIYWGNRVRWAGNKRKMVQIPRANVNFMEGNQWNLEHAASIYQYMLEMGSSMEPIRPPAGRIHRVRVSDVKMSEKFEEAGELEEQLGMTEPWTRDDVGSYEAQLIDGNHRAAAALALGEPYLWVYVAENSLGEVFKKDLR